MSSLPWNTADARAGTYLLANETWCTSHTPCLPLAKSVRVYGCSDLGRVVVTQLVTQNGEGPPISSRILRG
jgi:hypothetical protein